MAIIKHNEYKTMTLKSMQEKLADLRKELLKLNAQIAIGTTPENSGKIKEIKRTISRIYTHISLKNVGGDKKV